MAHTLPAWIRRLFPNRPAHRPALRPMLETLEDRCTPSVAFAGQQTVAVGGGPHGVATADFNGDGRPDLVTVNLSDGTASVLLNTTVSGASGPTFGAQATFSVGNSPQAVAVGDFNGDGRPDLVVANYNTNTVSVLLDTTPTGATVPSFAAAQTFAAGDGPVALAVADFNGDGRPDIVVADFANNTVSVLLNTTPAGATIPSFATPQTFAVGFEPESVAVGDINGDGRPDLVVADFTDNCVSVLLNTTAAGATAPSFAPQTTFAVGKLPSSVAVADFNGDGRPDLVVANEHDGTASVLLNTTAVGATVPSFAPQTTFAVGLDPISVTTADFDGDGRPDVVVANLGANNTSVLLNTTATGATAPSFAGQQTFAVGGAPESVATADFNGDGRPDIITANDTAKTASVLVNTTTPFANTSPVVVADFQGQGVWEYNRVSGAWVQLLSVDASLLAADAAGDVAADFPHYGVWEYHAASGAWTLLNGTDATALAMDARGDVAVTFPGYGVAEHLPASGWRLLSSAAASLLTMDANGDIVGEFPGYGLWEYRPAGGWASLNTPDATVLAMNAQGDVVANVLGLGVEEYLPTTGWRLLNGTQAQAVAIDGNGDVTASFHGYGMAEYLASSASWGELNATEAALLDMAAGGDVYADFAGYGVWEYNHSRGWFQLRTGDAALLVVA